MSKFNTANRLREQTYISIREAIISGRLKPREKLSDKILAEEMGVSRTPIREALHRLVAEGLANMTERGIFVADLDLKHMFNVYQMRAAIEGFAARIALPFLSEADLVRMQKCIDEQFSSLKDGAVLPLTKAGTNFHLILVNKCENELLIQTACKLMTECERFRAATHYYVVTGEATIPEHAEILRVVKEGNPDLVEKTLRTHLLNIAERIARLGQQIVKGGE